MNTRYLQIAAAADARVDSIDVAQLLRDLGEASASSSAVDLFGLCLRAQRVLEQADARGVAAEVRVLSCFRAMSDECRAEVLCMLESLADAYPRRRPTLTLVRPGQSSLGGSR